MYSQMMKAFGTDSDIDNGDILNVDAVILNGAPFSVPGLILGQYGELSLDPMATILPRNG
jgi:hypothetical protein